MNFLTNPKVCAEKLAKYLSICVPSQMILQVGLGIQTVEQVAVEVVEAKASDEDLELLTGYGRPDLEGEAVLGAI